jgi:hypothetical protein
MPTTTTDRKNMPDAESAAKSRVIRRAACPNCGAEETVACWREADRTRGVCVVRVLAAHGLDPKGKAL